MAAEKIYILSCFTSLAAAISLVLLFCLLWWERARAQAPSSPSLPQKHNTERHARTHARHKQSRFACQCRLLAPPANPNPTCISYPLLPRPSPFPPPFFYCAGSCFGSCCHCDARSSAFIASQNTRTASACPFRVGRAKGSRRRRKEEGKREGERGETRCCCRCCQCCCCCRSSIMAWSVVYTHARLST